MKARELVEGRGKGGRQWGLDWGMYNLLEGPLDQDDLLPAIEALLAAGANPNAVVSDEDGDRKSSPMTQAHTVAAMRVLLKAGGDPNFDHGLPLFDAVDGGQVDLVKLLLAAGADPNISENADGWTLVEQALDEEEVGIARLLVKAGADISGLDEDKLKLLKLPKDVYRTNAKRLLAKPAAPEV